MEPESITWAEAGPEIQRRNITVTPCKTVNGFWKAECRFPPIYRLEEFGQTPLDAIAALLRSFDWALGKTASVEAVRFNSETGKSI